MIRNKFSFGDVVLLEFPFTDGESLKKRPALVLTDTKDGDLLLARITSQAYRSEYDLQIQNWQFAGLKLISVIRLHKIATLESSMVIKRWEYFQ